MSAALLFCFYASFRVCGPQLPVLFQQGLEVLAGKAAGHFGHLLRGTLGAPEKFGVSPDVATAALRMAGKKTATVEEARTIITEFANREVK